AHPVSAARTTRTGGGMWRAPRARRAGAGARGGGGGGRPTPRGGRRGGSLQAQERGGGGRSDPEARAAGKPSAGPGGQHRGERAEPAAGRVLPPVPVQRAGGGEHVVEQVGGGDRRAGRAQHADLERQQQDGPGDAGRGGDGGDDEGGRQGHGFGPSSAGHAATLTASGPSAYPLSGKFAQVKP